MLLGFESVESVDHLKPSNDAENSPQPVLAPVHVAWSLRLKTQSVEPLPLAAPGICACGDHSEPSNAAYQRRWSVFSPFQAA